jgi:acetoin utilization deacetylase AcuC-like enzyme
MRKTGFLFDRRYLLHETGAYHPEVPARLEAVYKGIEEGGLLPNLRQIQGSLADVKWVETVHSRKYVQRLGDACIAGKKVFDCPDNQMCSDTYETALLAVGGILNILDLMMQGEIDNAFCAVRPPGHHAERDEAMGFCYFNNVAIAARYLQIEHGIERVGIIDFDVHHGNGTQHLFEQDASVFYYSIHQHPSFAYPGTGREFETGTLGGHGFTKNSPMLPGQGDSEYKKIFERDLSPAFNNFKPQVILVSTGFDGHADDDMSDMQLSTEWYTWAMQEIMTMADTHSGGHVVSVLEGGYCLRRLPELACNHVKVLLEI